MDMTLSMLQITLQETAGLSMQCFVVVFFCVCICEVHGSSTDSALRPE